MNILANLFLKLRQLLVGKPTVDMRTVITELHPDALVMNDIFPKMILNTTFVVLPSVDSGCLPPDLLPIIQRNDGVVTFVFTGKTADLIADVASDPLKVADILAGKLVNHEKLVDSFVKIMTSLTTVYNIITPGPAVTQQQLLKKTLAIAGVFMANQQAFKTADEFYKSILVKFLIDGQLTINLPKSVDSKLAKLGFDKISENSPAALAIQVAELQINNLITNALQGMKGDIQVY